MSAEIMVLKQIRMLYTSGVYGNSSRRKHQFPWSHPDDTNGDRKWSSVTGCVQVGTAQIGALQIRVRGNRHNVCRIWCRKRARLRYDGSTRGCTRSGAGRPVVGPTAHPGRIRCAVTSRKRCPAASRMESIECGGSRVEHTQCPDDALTGCQRRRWRQ